MGKAVLPLPLIERSRDSRKATALVTFKAAPATEDSEPSTNTK